MSGETLAILPAYNEELSIGSIVLRARQHIDHDIAMVLKNEGVLIDNIQKFD